MCRGLRAGLLAARGGTQPAWLSLRGASCSCWGDGGKSGGRDGLQGVSAFAPACCQGPVGTAGCPGMVHMLQESALCWQLACPSL